MRVMAAWLVLSMIAASAHAGDGSAEFEEHVFTQQGGAKMPYRMLKPERIEPGKKYPLVLALHGWGERGSDNQKQLKNFGPLFAKPGVRKRFPCFVILPQANGSWVMHPKFDKPIRLNGMPVATLAMAHAIVKAEMRRHPVDPDRLYLMGYSNGACGLWELLEREPHAWAAATPMAGAGDPATVGPAKVVAIWAFHGEKDPTIPLDRMRELMAALQAARGHPMFTIYPGGVHWSALAGLNDPNLLPWMFAQRRGAPHVPFDDVAKLHDKRPTSLRKK